MGNEAWGRKVDCWLSAYGRREQWEAGGGAGGWKLEGKPGEGGSAGKKSGRMGSEAWGSRWAGSGRRKEGNLRGSRWAGW